jgi:hypothetical protein
VRLVCRLALGTNSVKEKKKEKKKICENNRDILVIKTNVFSNSQDSTLCKTVEGNLDLSLLALANECVEIIGRQGCLR